jgi:hypothetical protein
VQAAASHRPGKSHPRPRRHLAPARGRRQPGSRARPAWAAPVDSYPSGETASGILGLPSPRPRSGVQPVGGLEARTIRLAESWMHRWFARSSLLGPPLRAATGFRTYCSAGAKSGRAVPGLPSGDPRRLLRVGASSYLMAPWPPAFTEIARFPAPPRASGAGVLQRDLLAVLETRDGPQCDGDAFRPVGLPGDVRNCGCGFIRSKVNSQRTHRP